MSSAQYSRNASRSPRLYATNASRAVLRFSSDIARAVSRPGVLLSMQSRTAAFVQSGGLPLLREPSGFEGQLLFAVILEVGDEPITIGRDDRQRPLLFDTAPSGDGGLRPDRQYLVPQVSNVREVCPQLEDVQEPRHELLHASWPDECSLHLGGLWLEDHVLVVCLQKPLHVASIEGLGARQKVIHVLPRHRPQYLAALRNRCFSS